jgi:PhnB protein
MSVGVYLYFNGNCREAAEFYADAFGADKPKILTYGGGPGGAGDLPEKVKNLVLHAELNVAGDKLMLSDATPDRPVNAGNNVSAMVGLETPDKVRAVFDRLKAGGQVIMDVQETFFNTCYAYLTDKFGVNWQLSVKSLKD